MDEEIWRPVPGFPGYDVSNLGRVRSWKVAEGSPPRILNPKRPQGYRRVDLRVSGRRTIGCCEQHAREVVIGKMWNHVGGL